MVRNIAHKERAHAKLNLSLGIYKPKTTNDGRKLHPIESVVGMLSLHDTVHISKETKKDNDGFEISSIAENKNVPIDENSLNQRAAREFIKYAQLKGINFKNQRIFIDIKNTQLPVAGGLGAGSAHAAAVLRGMNTVFETNFTKDELASIGFKLGSDVPVCTYNYPLSVMSSFGEEIEQLDTELDNEILICIPKVEVPKDKTKTAYQTLDKNIKKLNMPDTNSILHSLKNGKERLFFMLHNSFLDVELPWIGDSKNVMDRLKECKKKEGCEINHAFVFTGLAGAGPTVFGIFSNNAKDRELINQFNNTLNYNDHALKWLTNDILWTRIKKE